MKLYRAYKKQFYDLFLLVILVAVVFLPYVFSYAETAEEIRNKINQKSADIAKLEEDIKKYQSELEVLGKQKDSLSVSIKELDVTKKKLIADISVTQKKIDKTNLKIQGLNSDIGDKENSISNHINSIALEIRKTNEFELENFFQRLLSNNDFSSMWTEIDNIATVREKLVEHIGKLKETKGKLEDTRNETIQAKNELVSLKIQLGDQQKIVVQNVNEKSKLLASTKNSESNYQKLVKDQQAKKLAFEKELRDYESRLQFILDPSKLPNAGVLSWPLDEIYVTQEFGAKTGPHRTYVNGHSGTDFRARTPQQVYAMADGVVVGTGDTDVACPGASFGKWILVEYNNGLSSTFAHLSLIKVSKGQKVSRGEAVGYTGSSGRVTGPHLHVSLYVAGAVKADSLPSVACPGRILTQPLAPINAYLDPMYYLPPLKR